MELPVDNGKAQTTAAGSDTQRRLLDVVAGLARELHPQHTRLHGPSLASRLERHLGIDSLGALRDDTHARLQRRGCRGSCPCSKMNLGQTGQRIVVAETCSGYGPCEMHRRFDHH